MSSCILLPQPLTGFASSLPWLQVDLPIRKQEAGHLAPDHRQLMEFLFLELEAIIIYQNSHYSEVFMECSQSPWK